MKKFFAIAVIAIAFVACNNDADKKETPTDTVVVAPTVDTVVVAPVDTVVVAPADTTAPKM